MISGNERRSARVSPREQSVVLIDHSPLAIFAIDDLHELGYDVIFVGKNRSLQAASDRFIDISPVSDISGTVDAIRRLSDCRIVGVYPALEHVKLTEHAVKSALGFFVPSSETFLKGRDKYRMKQALVAAQIPTASFRFILDDEIASPPFAFPFIVKPNLGFASGGVQLVKDSRAFAQAVKTIRRLNRFLLHEEGLVTGTICEEFVDGPEYSVDCITVRGTTKVFCVCGRGFVARRNFQDYVYYTPSGLSVASLCDLESLIGQMLTVLGYGDGPSHTELRFDQSRKQWRVLETALRVGGVGLIGELLKLTSGVPYNQLAFRASMGTLSLNDLLAVHGGLKLSGHGVLFLPAMGKGGKIKAIGGLAFLKSDKRVAYFKLAKNVGEFVSPYPYGVDLIGCVIGKCTSTSGLKDFIKRLCSEVIFRYES